MTTTPIFSPERARRDSEDPRLIVDASTVRGEPHICESYTELLLEGSSRGLAGMARSVLCELTHTKGAPGART